METQGSPAVGAATMAGFTVGLVTAGVAGNSAAKARARTRVIDARIDQLVARELKDPTAQRLREARLQLLHFERITPDYVAQRSGRAAVAGALLAVGSLVGGPLYAATRS